MKWKNRVSIFLFNFLFLFYTFIGPAKTLYYHIVDPFNTVQLHHIEHFIKVRLDKKYLQQYKNGIQTASTSDSQKFHSYSEISIYYSSKRYLSSCLIISRISQIRSVFSNVPIRFLHCTLKI